MDFRTAYMIRKHLDGILFSDIIVEISAASLEKLRMKVYSFYYIISGITDSQLRPPTAALAEIFGKCRTNIGFVGNSGEK